MTVYTSDQVLKRAVQSRIEDMLQNGGGRSAFVTSIAIQGNKAIARGAFNNHISFVITIDDISGERSRLKNLGM